MKKFLNIITNNNPGILKKPILFEVLKSMLQGAALLCYPACNAGTAETS